MENIISTCFEASTTATRTIALYSHMIPMVLSLLLAVFVYLKSRKAFLSKILLFFIVIFSLWLLSDLIIWTSNKYNLIYALWAPLAYIEIVFYTMGLYFAMVFSKKTDISLFNKIILFLFTLPAFIITVLGQSVTGFNSNFCEANNNTFLDIYKLIIESGILFIILFYAFVPFFKKQIWKIKRTNLIVLGSMFLFLSVFGATEYISATTGVYEINLYSLFLLPVFILVIIYAVFELDIFNFHILGTHYLVVGMMILMCGQLFFINGITDRLLTMSTIFMTIGLSIILFRNLRKESNQRVQIEKLNIDLQNVIRQRESLMHLINHKVKGSFTHSKYIFAGLLDGMFGETTEEIKKVAQMGLDSDTLGIKTIDLILNAANLQSGTIKYELKPVDLKELVLKTIEEKKEVMGKKGLELEVKIGEENYMTNGDIFWLKEVANNLIDNAINYTNKGKIMVELEKKTNKIIFSIKDTGIGITPEDQKNLFTEGGRGKESVKINVNSTGYGLYSVKLIVEAHKGRVWALSEGKDKGSQFFVELNAL